MASRSAKRHIHLIDIVGAFIVIVCLGGALWFTMIREDDSGVEIARLEREIVRNRRELSALHVERDRERRLLDDRERRLKESGSLPSEAPVEQYLQTLSALAKQYGLEVMRQSPVPQREYPGLLERRHTYEVSGDMKSITRFFLAMEHTDFWADIGFLKIVGNDAAPGEPAARIASLTISIFSAPPPQTGSDRG